MATESVVRDPPGMYDLLIKGFQFENPQKIAQAALNASTPIVPGIRAIGELLACHAQNEDVNLDRNLISDIGWLLHWLADTVESIDAIGANATFQAFDIRSDARKGDDDEFVDVPVIGRKPQ